MKKKISSLIIIVILMLSLTFLPVNASNLNADIESHSSDLANIRTKGIDRDLCKQAPVFLRFGDIIFMDVKPALIKEPFNVHYNKGYSNDHCAFYIGFKWFIESSDYTRSQLRLFDGVQFTPMWFYRLWAHNFTYARVKASPSQKIGASVFAVKQWRDPYQYAWLGYDDYMSWHSNPDIDDPDSPYYYPDDLYVDYWTCAELVWAGYLHQGINIDATPYPQYDPNFDDYYYFVGIRDIKESENVTMLLEI